MEFLNELNPPQREAVTHGSGPLLVVAGAGSGKTRVLAYRVSYLISQGVAPERILLLTFTRRAAQEMLKRAGAAINAGPAVADRVWGGTFHAIANRLLRLYAPPAGVSPDFTIMDRTDAEDYLDIVRTEMGLSRKDERFPRKSTCLDIYSRRVNGNDELGTVLDRYFPWCEPWEQELKTLFREYALRKQRQNVLDYDDLLLYWYLLLQDEAVSHSMGKRFDHILVDEYQDTNRIQAGILIGMRPNNTNITAVGDDAQSIYSFRSATIRNMLDFPSQFPGSRICTLEENYRSLQPILETANLVISQSRERFSKTMWSERKGGQRPQLITCLDEDHQDEAVISRVLELYEQGVPLRRQAVLFRAATHSASLELALTRRRIPFHKYGGLRFLEAAHIKDLIGFLRIAENPRDEIAWFRVLRLLRGVGPVTAAAVFQHLQQARYDASSLQTFRAPPAAREEMAGLESLIKDLKDPQASRPLVRIERVRQFYGPILERTYEDPQPRVSDLERLAQLAAGYDSLRQFLDDLVLDPPVSTGDLAGTPLRDEDWLVLSTIHSAKGLEWDAVYLIHAADGCLPSDMATGDDGEIDEELRLTYVAMTRARDYLYVLWPLRYYARSCGIADRHSYAQVCRFFTPEVIETMDRIGQGRTATHDTVDPDLPRADIASRITGMWQ